MNYAASSWTSYRLPPRTPSDQGSTDAKTSSDSVLNAVSDILSRSPYHPDHDLQYRHPFLDLRQIDGAEPGTNFENSSESSSNIGSAASRWSSYRTPRYPSRWPSNWSLVNTRPNGALQITVTPTQPKCTAR